MACTAVVRLLGAGLGMVAFLTMPQSIRAQTVEELDKVVAASAKPKDAMALAGSQVQGGAWLEALATLERVLAVDPKHKQARLLHASILCRIDDPDGAAVEFARLKAGDYKKAEWADARQPCDQLKVKTS